MKFFLLLLNYKNFCTASIQSEQWAFFIEKDHKFL